ncbi:MAG: response regulator, partial [Kiritimatiellae bacterium]|nr:response regulator [Kiritimatiellia bacterium]
MNSCKILVVEDDPSIRRVIMVALKRDGYTNIEEVTDGNEAVDMAFRFRPDLVLLDIMTGYGQDEYGLGLYWQDR